MIIFFHGLASNNQSALSLPAPHVEYEQDEWMGQGGTLAVEGVRREERLRAN